MKRSHYKSYFAAGVTAFCVIAAAILLFFLLFHASVVRGFLTMLARILRPIFLGMIIAFLLLPIHRGILRFMMAMTPNSRLENQRDVAFLNILAMIFSLFFAFKILGIALNVGINHGFAFCNVFVAAFGFCC